MSAQQSELGISVEEAARRSDLSRRQIYNLMASGDLESASVGGRRLVNPESLERLFERSVVPLATISESTVETDQGSESVAVVIVQWNGSKMVEVRVDRNGTKQTLAFAPEHLSVFRVRLTKQTVLDVMWEHGVRLYAYDPENKKPKPLPVKLAASTCAPDGSAVEINLISQGGKPLVEITRLFDGDPESITLDPRHLKRWQKSFLDAVSQAVEAGVVGLVDVF